MQCCRVPPDQFVTEHGKRTRARANDKSGSRFIKFGCRFAVEADQNPFWYSMRSLPLIHEVCRRRSTLEKNVGSVDQYVRIVVGLALLAFAFQDGLSIQGWHWAGLVGLVLLVTAFFKSCPLYSALGLSTCPVRQ